MTVELRADLHAMLESEAQRAGIEFPQYLREAALTRAIAGSMLGAESRFELLARAVGEAMEADEAMPEPSPAAELVLGAMARLASAEPLDEGQAVGVHARTNNGATRHRE